MHKGISVIGSASNKSRQDTYLDFDSHDWELLRTDDFKIRSRRRSMTYNSSSSHTRKSKSQIDEESVNLKSTPVVVGQDTGTNIHASVDEKNLDVCPTTMYGEIFNANEPDELFPIRQRNDAEWQDDKAQIDFEERLRSDEDEQRIPPEFRQDSIDDDFEQLLDDHFVGIKFVDEVEVSAEEWDEHIFESDEYDDAPDIGIPVQVVRITDQISRSQRARQQAIEIGEEFNWDKTGIELLTDIFTKYGWNSAKRAMQRELGKGLTPAELQIAAAIREIWCECPEFSINFGWRRLWANSVCGASRDHFAVLSWPTAIQLTRLTSSLPDVDEIQHVLDELYALWYSSNRLQNHYPSFHKYLRSWLDFIANQTDLDSFWATSLDEMYECDFDEDDDNFDPGHTTPKNQILVQFGLIPANEKDMAENYFSHARLKTFGKALVLRSMQIE